VDQHINPFRCNLLCERLNLLGIAHIERMDHDISANGPKSARL
jgi:hypothetical protein